ncbi:MAG: hypothetical protein ACT6TH_15165 [Brevundimonas sp.]|uniref:hypothetical protein n=1 Tax=Brevundimonas sp. TaxID=1871086 RepID=UPI00403430ED
MTDFDRWRSSGAYLPEFMRDFHDQKDLFKALQDVVDRANAKHGGLTYLNATWTDYHTYTVDIFLWVMAGHGFTLQRARRKFAFGDIWSFVSKARDAARAQSAAILSQVFATAKAGTKRSGVDHDPQ